MTEFVDMYLSLWFSLASLGCLWSTFGDPWADLGLLLTLLGTLGLPLGVSWAPVIPFGMPLGSLWPASGVPLAVLDHMDPVKINKKLTIIDERGCNLTSNI